MNTEEVVWAYTIIPLSTPKASSIKTADKVSHIVFYKRIDNKHYGCPLRFCVLKILIHQLFNACMAVLISKITF